MRRLAYLFLAIPLACSENTTQADFTGARVNILANPPLALTTLEVAGTIGEALAFEPSPRVVELAAGTFSRRQLVLVLESRFDGQTLTLRVEGKDAAGEVLAAGETEIALRLGLVPTATVTLEQPSGCGNGLLEPQEACDDGNRSSDDGCDAQCAVETGYLCGGAPSRCGLATETALVRAAAPCPGNGTEANPFCTIGRALEVPWAKVVLIAAGNYDEQLELSSDRRIFAAPGAVLLHLVSPAFAITGGRVELEGLTIRGGARDLGGGLSVRGANTQATLRRLDLGPGSGVGLSADDGAFLDLTQSRVRRQAGGGLRLGQLLGYAVENVYLIENGNNSSALGGAWLGSNPVGARFAYNTVVDNLAEPNTNAGVDCSVPGTRVEAGIVFDNGTVTASAAAACDFRYSDLGPLAAGVSLGGSGNFSDPPQLDADYHLSASSPCIDRADGSAETPALDYDGEARPKGPGPDVGADER